MLQVARLDVAERHRDKEVGGAEGRIDSRDRAESGAKPPVAFDERRQPAHERPRTESGRRPVVLKRGPAVRARLNAPGWIAARCEPADSGRMGGGIDAGQARTTDHRVHGVMARIGPKATPQEFEHAPAAMGLGDAGSSDLEKAHPGPARIERLDLEFTRAVEAEMTLGHVLPQEAIGADDARRSIPRRRHPVDDDEMIADAVEPAEVAAGKPGGGVGDRPSLLEEDAIAKPLGPPHLLAGRCETRFERAGAGQDRAESSEIAPAGKALQERSCSPPLQRRCECQRQRRVPANPCLCPKSTSMVAGRFYDARVSASGADLRRQSSSSALAVSATTGARDDRCTASCQRSRRVASAPSTPGILRSIRMRSNGDDAPGAVGAASRNASSPSLARVTSKPRRRKAFCAIRALISLSSASSARRVSAFSGGDGGADDRGPSGNSAASRSNSERTRTGFTSQPSKPCNDVSPKARRSNGEKRTRLRCAPAARAARASRLVASGPSAQSTMTRSGRIGWRSAARPDSRPSARATIAPASASRAAIDGASNGELAMMRARLPASPMGFGSLAAAGSAAVSDRDIVKAKIDPPPGLSS